MYIIRPDNDVKQKVISEIENLDAGKTYTVTIEQKEKPKTRQQEKYFHKLLGIICDYTGDDLTHMKRLVTWNCGIREIFEAPDRWIEMPKQTRNLSVSEYATLIQAAQMMCLELGLKYPDPMEYGYRFGGKDD